MPEILTSPHAFSSFNTSDSSVTVITTTGTRADYTSTPGVGVVNEVPEIGESADSSQWALEWLASAAAKKYEGRWVALGPDRVVRAAGNSPSALRESIAGDSESVILFVVPQNILLVGGSRLIDNAR